MRENFRNSLLPNAPDGYNMRHTSGGGVLQHVHSDLIASHRITRCLSNHLILEGRIQGEGRDDLYDARQDLDQDGVIGFTDFLAFAAAFGQTTGDQ